MDQTNQVERLKRYGVFFEGAVDMKLGRHGRHNSWSTLFGTFDTIEEAKTR